MKKWLIIVLLIFISSCARRSYRPTDIFEKGIPKEIERIQIDKSYSLYRREVFKDKDVNTERFIVKENKELTSESTEAGKLIEVEYLLISTDHDNALYITTIPDRKQIYYENNKLPSDIVNIQDFNTFHLGKITADKEIEFLFPDNHGSNTWELYQKIDSNKTLSIKRLIFKVDGQYRSEIRADLSLADTIEFQHVGKFFLNLSKPVKKNDERKMMPSKDNIVYVRKKRSGHQLLFRFNEPINKRDSTIVFVNKLIRHTPVPLLKN